MDKPLEDNIHISLPVKIEYHVLEAFFREKLIGERIETGGGEEESKAYAEILKVSLNKSPLEHFDVALDLTFRLLTSFFKNKEGRILLHASVNLDEHLQEISVTDYKLEGKGKSWLMNRSLQTLANTFLQKKIKEKMKFHFRPLVEKQLIGLNKKLEDSLEATKGVYLSGFLNDFRIRKLVPGDKLFLVFVEIEGNALVDIKNLDFSK